MEGEGSWQTSSIHSEIPRLSQSQVINISSQPLGLSGPGTPTWPISAWVLTLELWALRQRTSSAIYRESIRIHGGDLRLHADQVTEESKFFTHIILRDVFQDCAIIHLCISYVIDTAYHEYAPQAMQVACLQAGDIRFVPGPYL